MSNLDAKFRLKDDNGKGLSKNDLTDNRVNKIDNSPFDSNDVLYNGTTPNAKFINEGGTFQWTAGNASIIVPVVAGRRVRIEGRELSPNSLTNVWLTSNVSTVGTVPAFAFNNFTGSSFYGDGDFTVPNGATYLYILFFSNTTSTTKITDLDNPLPSSFLVKQSNLPNGLYSKVATRFATDVDISKRIQAVITKNTYVAIGRDASLYFDSQLTLPDSTKSHFLTSFTGNSLVTRINRGIRYAPVTTASNITASYTLRDFTNKQIATYTKNIVTVNPAGATGTKNIMFIGDSYIETGIIPFEVYRLLRADGYTINEIGTVNTLYAPSVVKCEGRSGWTMANYANDANPTVNGVARLNPFYKGGVLDFSSYLTDNSLTKPDVVVINLTINDLGGFGNEQPDSTFSLVSSYISKFLSAMLTAWSGTKIVFVLPHLGAYQFGNTTSMQDFRTINLSKMGKKIIDVYDENRYNTRVFVSDANQSIDRIEGHAYTTQSTNVRLPSYTEKVYSDVVHPSASGISGSGTGGYYQMSDSIYSIVTAILKGII